MTSDNTSPVGHLATRVFWIVQGFPLRTAAALADYGVNSMEDLSSMSRTALLIVPGMGEIGIMAVEELLGRAAGRPG